MTAAKKRGRPPFKPTAAQRRTVERMVACGDTKDTIARAIGISTPTLDLHFQEQLLNGWAKKRREILNMLYDGAKKGNATLIKRLEEMTRTVGAAAEFERGADEKKGEPVRSPARAPKLGKKEIQREEAFNAGVDSEWADDLAPLPGTRPN